MDVWAINNVWVAQWIQPDFWHHEFYNRVLGESNKTEHADWEFQLQNEVFSFKRDSKTKLICTAGCHRIGHLRGTENLQQDQMYLYERLIDPRECAKEQSDYTCTTT